MSLKHFDFNYMQICSEKTLQTNSKGFFLDFVGMVTEHVGKEWIKSTFGSLKTDKDRIAIIYNYDKVKCILIEVLQNVQEVYRAKSAEVAQARRKQAESANLKEAVILYSQSILRSPSKGLSSIDNGYSLALGLIGRAQVFLKQEKYELALSDFKLSLKEQLDQNMQSNVYWKMAICYKALKQDKQAEICFGLAEKMLDSEELKEHLRKDKIKDFKCNKDTFYQTGGLPCVQETNKQFPQLSKKLYVKQEESLGRFIIAKSSISTGEVLATEKPFAASLLPEKFGTHCYNCFQRFEAPIGCTVCSSVAFCSQQCRDSSKYHKFECKILDLLIGSGMSILAFTALRMITLFSLEENIKMFQTKSNPIFKLCTNSNLRPSEDFFQRTLMAAFLLRCLQISGYFESKTNNILPGREELIVGELLLFYLQILQFNAHEIYETVRSKHKFRKSIASYIGVAIYPTSSLFNHDCQICVTRHFVGKDIVIRAAKPLKPSETVSENYGPIFTEKTLQERQRSLSSRYWFVCQCEACVQNWPGFKTGLDNLSKRIRCVKSCDNTFNLPLKSLKLTCPKCNKTVDLKSNLEKLFWAEEQFQKGFNLMDNEEVDESIAVLTKAIDAFHLVSKAPHRELHLAQAALRSLYADSGNVFEMR